jgi:hypothetical protein
MAGVHARVAILERSTIIADHLRMKVTPGRMLILLSAAVVGTAVLAVVLHAAGKPGALGVAIAAMTAMVLLYVRIAVMVVRAYGDEQAPERVLRYVRKRVPATAAVPLVVTAAWPWGPASPYVGLGAFVLCIFILARFVTLAGVVHMRRARRKPTV